MTLQAILKRGLFCFLLFNCIQVNAQLKLPSFFTSNMVLQRNKPVPVWGTATPGIEVTVYFASQKKTTIADAAGNWNISLNALQVSAIPQDLVVQAESTITLNNILVGDVWLCTGQSNMEYPLDRTLKRYAAPERGKDLSIDALTETKPDGIRYMYVERTLNKIPVLPTKGWVNGMDTIIRYVSAIGYFFANEVNETTNVPIGIISSSWGGTRIEQWTPDWAYKESKIFKDSVTSADYEIDGMHPGQMFKGMIEPLIPFSIKGILWYQGESNCMVEDQSTYVEKFKLFINSWRNLFHDKQLPIYTVQISPFLYSSRKDPKKHTADLLPQFWEAQTNCLKISNTEMVVTTDLVDKLSDIHPSYKWIVGHRLALSALAKSYQQKQVIYQGPVFYKMKQTKQHIEIQFKNAGTGLVSSNGEALTWFTIAGADGNFVKADAVISGNKVIVSSPAITKPAYVRFAWDETAQPNLVNAAGLPAIPFRTKL